MTREVHTQEVEVGVGEIPSGTLAEEGQQGTFSASSELAGFHSSIRLPSLHS